MRMTSEDGKTKGGIYLGEGDMLSRKDCGDFSEVTAKAADVAFTIHFYPERIEIAGDRDFSLDFVRTDNLFETGFDEKHVFYRHGNVSYALALDNGRFDGKTFRSESRSVIFRFIETE